MTGPGVFKFIANQPNINQFSLQNQGPLQNQRTGPLKYTQKSLTNNPLQNQYSAKIILKWPSENLLYKIKDLLSCYQSASKTSTFWTLKTDPTPPDFVEETDGGIQISAPRSVLGRFLWGAQIFTPLEDSGATPLRHIFLQLLYQLSLIHGNFW